MIHVHNGIGGVFALCVMTFIYYDE
jgi:hypothetical protein